MAVIVIVPKRKMLPTYDKDGNIVNIDQSMITFPIVVPPLMHVNLLSAVEFIIDGGGAVITTGQKGHVRLPFVGSIVSMSLVADQSGSIVIDIWKDKYANFPPTNADSITASAPPTLSSAQATLDSALAGWTKTFDYGDFLAFNVDSCSTIKRVTLTLVVRRV